MIPRFVSQAHAAQLLGAEGYTYGSRRELEREFHPYGSLAGPMEPYDLNQPGRVRELKRAMKNLAIVDVVLRHAPPERPEYGVPIDADFETRWKSLTDDDVWDDAAGEEFLFAVSRYTFAAPVPAPYVQAGFPGGVPQPSVNGIELLAGVVNERFGGGDNKLKLYEAWRKTGCLVQAICLDPPSGLSRPSADTPVTLSVNTGLRIVAPPTAPASLLEKVWAADDALQDLWSEALMATTEADRKAVDMKLGPAHAARTAAVQAAIAAAPERQGTTVLDSDVAFKRCQAEGGSWDLDENRCLAASKDKKVASMAGPLLLVGGAVALYLLTQKKGRKR